MHSLKSPASKMKRSSYNFGLINTASYITLCVIMLQVFRDMPTNGTRFASSFLFVLFGVGLALFLKTENKPRLVHLYLAIQTLLTLGVFFIAPKGALEVQTLYFILSAQAMLFLPLRQGFYWLAMLTLVTFLGAFSAEGIGLLLGSLAASGGYMFFGLFGASLKQAEEAKRKSQDLLENLYEANAQLKAYAAQEQQLAISEERNRISREMHDSLGHRLTVAVIQLEGAKRLMDTKPEQSSEMIDTTRAELKEGLNELRSSIRALRKPYEEPLELAIAKLAEQFQTATGLKVKVDLVDTVPLPKAVHHALFRAAQEGLTNIQKHAEADNVMIELKQTEQSVCLRVTDDGRGLKEASEVDHYGIQGLKERAEKLGGSLILETTTLEDSSLSKTTLSIDIPLSLPEHV